MTKQEALKKAADAVHMMYVAEANYGSESAEFEAATDATRDKFLIARAHGATEADLHKLKAGAR